MKSDKYLESLLKTYESTFDLYRPYVINEEEYPAYGYFFSHLEKYVLVREVNLWSADSHEHILFQTYDQAKSSDVKHLKDVMADYMEPQLVRKGEPTVPENHMYSYLTVVVLSEQQLSKDTIQAVRKFKFEKGYQMNIRGYSQGRIVAVDLEQEKVYSNYQGRKLKKHFNEMLKKYKKEEQEAPVLEGPSE